MDNLYSSRPIPLVVALHGDVNTQHSTMKVFYSKGEDGLQAVTEEMPNNNSGWGRFELGIMKKSTGAKNMWLDGYHESHIYESQIYGGIFVEDSSGNCVSR